MKKKISFDGQENKLIEKIEVLRGLIGRVVHVLSYSVKMRKGSEGHSGKGERRGQRHQRN